MKSISLSSLGERYAKSWKRFPLVHAMLSLLMAVLLYWILFPNALSEAVFIGAWLFPAVGFLIALACALLRETGVLKHGMLADALALAAWLGTVVWICLHKGLPAGYLADSVAVLAVVARLTVPFLKDKDDERLFCGTCDILRGGFPAGIVAGVLLVGVELLVLIGMDMLLGKTVDAIAEIAVSLVDLGVFGGLFLVRLPEPLPS